MKKILKKIKRKIGRRIPEGIKVVLRRGIRIIHPKRNPKIPNEELKIFELICDDFSVVFDVGAREDLSFYNIKKNCDYHLFEPNKKAVAVLKEKIKSLPENRIYVNDFGLSDKNENDCIYYEDSQSFVVNPLHHDFDTGQRYSLRTLDSYVVEINIDHIDFLKIDAEGLDYRIILGGLISIQNKVSYIQFEYWDGVRKFTDLLGDTFDFYLMMEPVLLEAIIEEISPLMSENQKKKDYKKSIIPLDQDMIDLIDKTIIPLGHGGNILGIKKNLSKEAEKKIIFSL